MVIGHIAVNVFRESVRDKVLYSLVFFAILLIAASYLLGQLTAGQDVKIIKDLGLAATSIIGLFIAVFIGVGLVSKEVERRSVYALLAKPIRRHEFVLGKYLGLVLTLAVNVAVMAIALYVVLAYMAWMAPGSAQAAWDAPALDPALLTAVFLIFVELCLITAVALFFSTFSSPILSAVLTFGVYVVGHFDADLRGFESVVSSPFAAALARGAYYVLPNLASFDVKADVVHGQPVPWSFVALSTGYGLVYIAHARADGDVHLLPPGLQVGGSPRMPPPARSTVVFGVAIAALMGASVALQVARDRATPVREETARYLYLRSGSAIKDLTVAYQTLAADVYWIRAIQHYGGDRLSAGGRGALRAAVSAARHHDHARPALHHRLPVRRHLPGRAAARRAGPSRPGHRAPAEGHAGPTPPVAVPEDIGFVYYWQRARSGHRGALVPPRGHDSRRAQLARAARGDDARAGRRPSVVTLPVGADPRDGR